MFWRISTSSAWGNDRTRVGNWDFVRRPWSMSEKVYEPPLAAQIIASAWIIRRFLGPLVLNRILLQRRMKAGIKVPQWWLPAPATTSLRPSTSSVPKSAFQEMTAPPSHPFFGPLTKQKWNDLVLIHAAHHLSFLIPRAS